MNLIRLKCIGSKHSHEITADIREIVYIYSIENILNLESSSKLEFRLNSSHFSCGVYTMMYLDICVYKECSMESISKAFNA